MLATWVKTLYKAYVKEYSLGLLWSSLSFDLSWKDSSSRYVRFMGGFKAGATAF